MFHRAAKVIVKSIRKDLPVAGVWSALDTKDEHRNDVFTEGGYELRRIEVVEDVILICSSECRRQPGSFVT